MLLYFLLRISYEDELTRLWILFLRRCQDLETTSARNKHELTESFVVMKYRLNLMEKLSRTHEKKTSRAEKEDWNTFWKNQYSWNSGPSQKSRENFIFSCQKYIQLSRLVRERLSVKWVNANRFPRPARFKCYRHWARQRNKDRKGRTSN